MNDLSSFLTPTASSGHTTTLTRTSARNLMWSFPQMIAHHSIGGCAMKTGDLLGSGTISGTEPDQLGSLLEMNQAGKKEIRLEGGEQRIFLQDGDTINIRGVCGAQEAALVGFGDCVGTILPAVQMERC